MAQLLRQAGALTDVVGHHHVLKQMGVAQVAAAQLRPLVVQLLLLVQIKRAKVRVPLQQHHQRLRNAPSQLRPRLVPQHQQLAGQLLFGQLDQLTQPQLEKKPVVRKRHN